MELLCLSTICFNFFIASLGLKLYISLISLISLTCSGKKSGAWRLEPFDIKSTSQIENVNYIRKGIVSRINYILNQGHKLIIVYPVPEMGFDPRKLLINKLIKNNFSTKRIQTTPILTTNFNVFKKRNQKIFDILDSVQNPNISRIYPHQSFCDNYLKNRCL